MGLLFDSLGIVDPDDPSLFAPRRQRAAANEPPPPESKGLGQTVKEGLVRGVETVGAGASALLGRKPEVVAADVADTQQYTPSKEELGFQQTLAERVKAFDEDKSAGNFFGILGTLASNPKQSLGMVAESVGMSAPAYASALAGAGGGALLGPVGAIAGGIAGYLVGNAATNVTAEIGGRLTKELQDRGVDPGNKDAVMGALQADPSIIDKVRGEGIKSGLATTGVETAVDLATVGAGKLLKPAKGLVQGALRGAGAMGGQAVGEGLGSMAGSAAVGETVSPGQALVEGALALGPGAVEGVAAMRAGRALARETPPAETPPETPPAPPTAAEVVSAIGSTNTYADAFRAAAALDDYGRALTETDLLAARQRMVSEAQTAEQQIRERDFDAAVEQAQAGMAAQAGGAPVDAAFAQRAQQIEAEAQAQRDAAFQQAEGARQDQTVQLAGVNSAEQEAAATQPTAMSIALQREQDRLVARMDRNSKLVSTNQLLMLAQEHPDGGVRARAQGIFDTRRNAEQLRAQEEQQRARDEQAAEDRQAQLVAQNEGMTNVDLSTQRAQSVSRETSNAATGPRVPAAPVGQAVPPGVPQPAGTGSGVPTVDLERRRRGGGPDQMVNRPAAGTAGQPVGMAGGPVPAGGTAPAGRAQAVAQPAAQAIPAVPAVPPSPAVKPLADAVAADLKASGVAPDNVAFTEVTADVLPDARTTDADGRATLSKREYRQLQRMARIFGKKVVVFRMDGAPDGQNFEGAVLDNDGGTIYINEKTKAAHHLVVAGHELAHQMRKDMPKVYEALRRSLAKEVAAGNLANFSRYYHPGETDAQVYARLRDPKQVDHLTEEFLADLIGNRFGEYKTWTDLFTAAKSSGEPNIVYRVAQAVIDFIDALLAKTEFRKFATDSMVTDLRKARQAARKAIKDYAVGQGQSEMRAEAERLRAGKANREEAAATRAAPKERQRDRNGFPIFQSKERSAKAKGLPPELKQIESRGYKVFIDGASNSVIDTVIDEDGNRYYWDSDMRALVGESGQELGDEEVQDLAAQYEDRIADGAPPKEMPGSALSQSEVERVQRDFEVFSVRTDANEFGLDWQWQNRATGELSDLYRSEEEAMAGAAAQPRVTRSTQRAATAARMLTKSESFKKWFGDSKVVDADGKPLVVYHGTSRLFDAFVPGAMAGIIYASDSGRYASQFAGREGSPNVMPLFLKAEKILDLTPLGERELTRDEFLSFLRENGVTEMEGSFRQPYSTDPAWAFVRSPVLVRALKASGFDGIKQIEGGVTAYGVFSPNQIKSATGNNGRFDAGNPDITRSKERAETEAPRTPASAVDNLIMEASRGERAVGKRVVLSDAEKAAIAKATSDFGLPAADVLNTVRGHKLAHPTSQGWAPLKFIRVKKEKTVEGEKPKFSYEYETVPYDFSSDAKGDQLDPGTKEYTRRVNSVARSMVEEVRSVFRRAQSGDKNAQNILAQAGWYKAMRSRLRQEFGGLGDLFADLLGATSPNTPVRDNWYNAVDSLRRAMRGDFDELMPKWVEWADNAARVDAIFRGVVNDMLDLGMSKKAIMSTGEYAWWAKIAANARELPDELLPTKESGKKYGFNGQNVVRAMVDLWRVVQNAEPNIRRGGTAPKAVNFSGNLIGFRSGATIDVWAARMLQRLAGGLRIPSMAESGVSGVMRRDGTTTLQFGFGQDAFARAAAQIRSDGELKADPSLSSINDDDLQAVVWFVEKELWTVNNWTSVAGEGGSFELEANLTGTSRQDRVRELRKIIDSSPAGADMKMAAREDEVAAAARAWDRDHAEQRADLQSASAELVHAKEVGNRKAIAEARRRVEELEKAAALPKMLMIDMRRVEAAKARLENHAKQQVAARAELKALERPVDRFVGGLSEQMSMDVQGADYVPTDSDMSRLGADLTTAIYETDDGVTVLGSKALATQGRYGSIERSIDLEVVAREGYDISRLWRVMLEKAQASKQDSAFLSRVLREHEDVDFSFHRPGVEIYFREGANPAKMEEMLAALAKENVKFLTVIVDGRRTPGAMGGRMPNAVGVRLQYIPEFEQRYGLDNLSDLSDAEIAEKVQAKAEELKEVAARVSVAVEGVSFAGQFWYETQTAFAGEYQEKIDAFATGTSQGQPPGPRGKVWSGQSIRSGLARADRQPGETASREPSGQSAAAVGADAGGAAAGEGLTLSRQRAVTSTPEFQRWFAGSKVADADGAPLVVYHGTRANFTAFDASKDGSAQGFNSQVPGFWFATEQGIASQFGPRVSSFFLALRNPYRIPARRYMSKFLYQGADPAKYRTWLERRGYDGLIIEADPEYAGGRGPSGTDEWGQDNYVAFRPEQVKSATDNNGQFDPGSTDFTKSTERAAPTSQAFRRWFGRSKVVNPDGTPKVVFHGTTAEIKGGFRPSDGGIYFSDDPSIAGDVYGRATGSPNVEGIRAAAAKLSPTQFDALVKRLNAYRGFDFYADDYGDGSTPADQLADYAEYSFDEVESRSPADYIAQELGVPARMPATGSNVVPAYLSLQNPMEIDANGDGFDAPTQEEWITQARAAGHDGLIISNYHDGGFGLGNMFQSAGAHTVYIALRPEQVKSATGNNGAFDPGNPDITKSTERAPTRAQLQRRIDALDEKMFALEKEFGGRTSKAYWAEHDKLNAERNRLIRERWDVEAAADMRRREAKAARGDEGVVYHGTNAKFDDFDIDRGDLGIHFGTRAQAKERGRRLIRARLDLKNPLQMEDVGQWEKPGAVLEALSGSDQLDRNEVRALSDRVRGKADAFAQIRAFLESKGFDGVSYDNLHEDEGGSDSDATSYIVFRPEQVQIVGAKKSAERASPLADAAQRRFDQAMREAEHWLNSNGMTAGIPADAPAAYAVNALDEVLSFGVGRLSPDAKAQGRAIWDRVTKAFGQLGRLGGDTENPLVTKSGERATPRPVDAADPSVPQVWYRGQVGPVADAGPFDATASGLAPSFADSPEVASVYATNPNAASKYGWQGAPEGAGDNGNVAPYRIRGKLLDVRGLQGGHGTQTGLTPKAANAILRKLGIDPEMLVFDYLAKWGRGSSAYWDAADYDTPKSRQILPAHVLADHEFVQQALQEKGYAGLVLNGTLSDPADSDESVPWNEKVIHAELRAVQPGSLESSISGARFSGQRATVPTGPNSIWTATGNSGAFDPGNADITKSSERDAAALIRSSKRLEDKRDLLIQHNLTVENLMHAAKMGGIPVPSLAVVKADSPLVNFGDITMIGPQEMADPKGYAGTKVFGSDIYSPRYPSVTFDFTPNQRKRLEAELADGMKAAGDDYLNWSELSKGPRELSRMLPFVWTFAKAQQLDPQVVYETDERYKGKVNRWATQGAIEKQLRQRDLMPALDRAAVDMFDRIAPNERIFRGFSYSGKRMYKPHTLETVVQILKKELRGGENFNYGVGSTRAKMTPQFRSVAAIRSAKDRLVTSEEFEAIKKELDAELIGLSNDLGLDTLEMTLSLVEDAGKMNVRQAAKEYNQDLELTDEQVASVYAFRDKLRNLPTEYFEAKILREVDLAEFKVAVVPSGIPAKAREYLQSRGVKIVEYVKGDNADRIAKIKQAADDNGTLFSSQRATVPTGPNSIWTATAPSKMDDAIRALQDKQIDLKRVMKAIRDTGKQIDDAWDPYLQEELYHGRTAKATKDFTDGELRPLLTEMQMRKVDIGDFEEFLHNRHAVERNAQIARVNPGMPDGGSGITNADARAYLAALDPAKRAVYDALSKRVDAITAKTRALLVASGLEKQETIDAWEQAYSKYVPLMREDVDLMGGGMGTGQGFSVRGAATRRAIGSNKDVIDILANVAMQRERAITRAEKNRVAQSVYGLAVQAPSKGFWAAVDPSERLTTAQQAALQAELINLGLDPLDAQNVLREPKQRYIDPRTGLVAERINPVLRSSPNVLATRVNGEERYVFFNANDERAARMVTAMKNLDADQLGSVMGVMAKISRWFAAVNTQYNPLWGPVNLIRDVSGGLFNLSTTPLAGKQAKVLGYTLSALKGIYIDIRDHRAGKTPTSSWAMLFEEFQREGGQTGYRDMYASSEERGKALKDELKRIGEGKLKAAGRGIFDWLTDYNDSMENAVRLAAYKTGKEDGLTNQQAASIAKNLTVNFNRKGQVALQAGALYAFFNASVQGSARMIETLRGPAGKKIIAGGLALGATQALVLAAAGMGDNEPPEFVRERGLIIPIGDGKYLTVPMPLGLHVIPSVSRITTEWALSGFRDTAKRLADLVGLFADAFNPVGNAGFSLQTIAPTAVDPLAALAENKDWSGKPIARQDMNSLKPTPGYTRAKDTASEISKFVSYWLNAASGGTKYQPGLVTPTPDQLDYLIGQITGGLGREILKVDQTVSSRFTGEELPAYKIPLLGRFYGETTGGAAESGKFYDNVRRLNMLEAEIKGRRAAGEPVMEFIRDNPEAMLVQTGNEVERQVSKLRKAKRELIDKGASRDRVRVVEKQIEVAMKRLNDRVRKLEDAE